MKLETTYENNNYQLLWSTMQLNTWILLPKDYDKVFFIIDANVYHQFSKKIDTLTKSIMRRKLSFLLANKLKHLPNTIKQWSHC